MKTMSRAGAVLVLLGMLCSHYGLYARVIREQVRMRMLCEETKKGVCCICSPSSFELE